MAKRKHQKFLNGVKKIKKEEILDYLEILKPKIDKAIEKYLPKKITKKWLNFAFGSNCQFNSKQFRKFSQNQFGIF